jgi:hypothetical protein
MTIKVASAQVLLTILAQKQNAQKQSTAGQHQHFTCAFTPIFAG